jgi:UV DNA damage endonuclease
MSIGVCCHWVKEIQKKNGEIEYKNLIEEKTLQLGRFKSGEYSEQRLRDTYHHNVDQHVKLIPELVRNNIKLFRMTSNLFSLFEFTNEMVKTDELLKRKLKFFGDKMKNYGIRVTCHPGQFTVISSDSDKVIENSIRELEYHAWIFDQMGFDESPYYAINIHGGKADRSDKLVEVIKTLPDNVRKRLTLENDENSYDTKQLLEISGKTDVPVVFDSHHHVFNTGSLSMSDAINETVKTWKNVKPLQHISNTEVGVSDTASTTERRKHSNYIRYIPEAQLNRILDNSIDVEIEAKAKNLAVLKMRKDFGINV